MLDFGKLKRLRGKGFKELRTRGLQAFHALRERHGWSDRCRLLPDDSFFKLVASDPSAPPLRDRDALLDAFNSRRDRFFSSFNDIQTTQTVLRGILSEVEWSTLLDQADRICEGSFDLLGLKNLTFGNPIDWHTDPISGRRAPIKHWSKIDYLDPSVAGDKKVIWELNRQQHLLVLGRAYVQTGNERYALGCASLLESWMDANPPKAGINWSSSLEVAFRAISWLWALHFLRGSRWLSPALFIRASKYIYIHAAHLETYLSTYFSPNTHLTGEALGLFYIGTALPQFRRAGHWQKIGRRLLCDELSRQVRPDGVYFEQSTYYQRYTTDIYLHFAILSRVIGSPVEGLEPQLGALLDFLMHVTRPDGTTPFIGDDDGGQLALLDTSPINDFRSTLATGAALLGRGDYKYVAGRSRAPEATLWLLGEAGVERFAQLAPWPPKSESRAFPDGGFYTMRDGWDNTSNFLVFDCGPHGALNCGHSHADELSFELAARGQLVMMDPGTYTYTGSPEARNHFRGSRSHNAVMLDGEASSIPGGPFNWLSAAQSLATGWKTTHRFDYCSGRHDGYLRLPAPAIVSREILFLKGDYWVVRDIIDSTGGHKHTTRFHFSPGSDLTVGKAALEASGTCATEAIEVTCGHRSGFVLKIYAPRLDGAWHIEEDWTSEAYGQRVRAPVAVRTGESTGHKDLITFFVPAAISGQAPENSHPDYTAAECALITEETNVAEGRVFRLQSKSRQDLLAIRHGDGSVASSAIITSCEWTWLRFGPEGCLRELVLLGGGKVEYQGRLILDCSAGRASYCCVKVDSEMLYVDTDAEILDIHTFGARKIQVGKWIADIEEFGLIRLQVTKSDGGAEHHLSEHEL
jgi:hypothetical protein